MDKTKLISWLTLQRRLLHSAGDITSPYYEGHLDGQLELISYLLYFLENEKDSKDNG